MENNTNQVNQRNTKSKWHTFLKDVMICSLGAYGGPEAHMSVFLDQMVTKKKYLKEEELIELIALCSVLPGPTSTQTIVSIGYKTGGPLLALFTMMVWALPVLTAMTILSFLYQFLAVRQVSQEVLRYIGPMAVGFIVVAAYRIGRKVVTDSMTMLLLVFGAVTTYFLRTPWVFPLVLLMGGGVSVVMSREKDLWNRVKLNPPWRYLTVFGFIALGSIVLTLTWDHRLITVAAVIIMQQSGFTLDNLVVTGITILLLVTKKIPAPLIVLAALAVGFL